MEEGEGVRELRSNKKSAHISWQALNLYSQNCKDDGAKHRIWKGKKEEVAGEW